MTALRSGRPVGQDDGQHEGEAPEGRDWKKFFLVAGLGILSWVATYVGMLELIEANMGELPLVHKLIIAFSVAMLMTMIIWLLDQLFAPIPTFTKLVYAVGYVFLSVISVGFGFGFYWKVLESRSEASRSAESAVTQVQSSLHGASTRLEQLSSTLVQLTGVSSSQAEVERAKGTSCPNSKPGDGPRRKLRDDDAARFNFASEFVKGRVGQVKTDLAALDGDLAKIAANDASLIDAKSGTRNEFMKALGRKLDLTVTGFNAFRTDPQLKQIRTDLAERAEMVNFVDGAGKPFACPDPQLQTALRGVVRAIDGLPELEKPKIAAVEGSEATIEAFRRLTTTFYGALAFKLPPSAEELRELQKKAVQSVEGAASQQRALMSEAAGLSKRDYVPLAVAIFVDLCLLLVSMGRPVNRMGGLVPKMRAAEHGPVFQILSRFSDIHRDAEIRQNFEIFRHVVFDHLGDYYVAVPLDAPYQVGRVAGPNGKPVHVSYTGADLADGQIEAHLLANLFASFEKERIFSRVHSPFLGTNQIRRKLRRQGSKFANSEAFRVYKFRDGAWSDIILGAVMGAAKRVEAEKRQRTGSHTTRTDATGRIEPDFTSTIPPSHGAPAAYADPQGITAHAADRSTRHHAARTSPAYASDGDTRRSYEVRPPMDPRHAERFGRYAEHVPHAYPPPPSAPVPRPAAPPANSNTAPAAAPVHEPLPIAEVIPLPGVQLHTAAANVASGVASAAEPTVEVRSMQSAANGSGWPAPATVEISVSRETRTMTVPISEAALPRALLSAVANVDQGELPLTVVPGRAAAPIEATAEVIALPPPVEPADVPAAVAATRLTSRDEPIDIDSISRRFAHTPAE